MNKESPSISELNLPFSKFNIKKDPISSSKSKSRSRSRSHKSIPSNKTESTIVLDSNVATLHSKSKSRSRSRSPSQLTPSNKTASTFILESTIPSVKSKSKTKSRSHSHSHSHTIRSHTSTSNKNKTLKRKMSSIEDKSSNKRHKLFSQQSEDVKRRVVKKPIIQYKGDILMGQLRNKPARTIKYLHKVCPDSKVCIGFGEEIQKIASVYAFYNDFNYLNKKNNEIVSSGANGMAILMEYERDNYKSHAILKIPIFVSRDHLKDNIFADIVNGYYINVLNLYYPCFMETYGIFRFQNDESYFDFIKKQHTMTAESRESINYNNLIPLPFSFDLVNTSCLHPHLFTVLIQYINNHITLFDYLLSNINKRYEFIVELIHILYQIYSVLSSCSYAYDFTHYDLHMKNILLYPIPGNKYITMRYYDIENKVIEFKTRYIVKIIDYGRCYTPYNEKLYRILCNSRYCSKEYIDKNIGCGYRNGYKHFYLESNHSNSYMKSNIPNCSHDLRLAYSIRNSFYKYFYNNNSDHPVIKQRVSEIMILFSLIQYESAYGTRQILPGDMPEHDINIYNVYDLHYRLLEMMQEPVRIQLNDIAYQTKESAGVMTIHLDRSKDIRFERA